LLSATSTGALVLRICERTTSEPAVDVIVRTAARRNQT